MIDRRSMAASAFCAALLCAAAIAAAAPPPNSDGRFSGWFQGLRQPGTGSSCCSIADCRLTDYRTTGNRYEAVVNGNWVVVPTDKILERVDNPTGRAVVCYTPGTGILCFVRPPEA